MKRFLPWIAICVGVCGSSVGACKSSSSPNAAAASASASAKAPLGIPLASASVQAQINPENHPIYSGPVGAVEGTIRITGDQAPDQPVKVSRECANAIPMYEKLFREGPGRTVADVMVAVTGYPNYVPAKGDAKRIEMRDCAYDHRTVVATYGQRLDMVNMDKNRSYIPILFGDSAPAHMVAVQGGDPVRLYPMKVGQYLLADEMNRPWMRARIYMLKFSTHAVTGLDGRYRIEGIPPGQLKINAFLPDIDAVAARDLTIEAGKTVQLDLELTYKKSDAPAPSVSAPSKLPEIR